MRILIYKGESQYDILSARAQLLHKQFIKMGHECVICNLASLKDGQQVFEFLERYKPDFTFGINSWGFNVDGIPHFELTKIPHIMYILDSPWHYTKAPFYKSIASEYVFPIFTERNYYDDFLAMGNKRAILSPYLSGNKECIIPFKNKLYDVVFFGSLTSKQDIINKVNKLSDKQDVRDTILQFIDEIEYYTNSNDILPHSLSLYVEDFVRNTFGVEGDAAKTVIAEIYPIVDRFYNGYVRKLVIERLAAAGVNITVYTNINSEQDLPIHDNVTFKSPVNYYEHLSIVSHSKVHLNITPTKISMHDRIPDTLINGTVLCSNEMHDFSCNYSEYAKKVLFYNLSTIEQTAESIKELLVNETLYNDIVNIEEIQFEREINLENEARRIIDAFNEIK